MLEKAADDDEYNEDSEEEATPLSYLKKFIDYENNFRLSLDKLLTDSIKGWILHHIAAISAGSSAVVYIVLTYNINCPLILNAWYN